MELRHLLYFKTVAEELHFRNAASRLFISQPPLSRQIKELEEELGVKLFERNNKKVILTEAGMYLKKEAEKILSQVEESKLVVKQIHQGVSGKLRVGYISSTYHVHLVNVLKQIPCIFPFVKTKLYEIPTAKQIKALEEGKLDIGILRTPVDSEKLKIIPLFNDPFVLVIPKTEQIYSDNNELKHFLVNEHFIFFNKDYAPEYHRKLIEICQRMGFFPDVVHEANNVHSILRLVESGLGVSIVPQSLKHQYAYLNIAFIELPVMPIYTEVVLAFKAQHIHPAAKWFIEKYSDLFH
ncbi:LysR family transcriptional regulator [Catalinimonas niigatensis]|uniref:LysR family transcriptional regulator n=1 Tax=Catalinimonas niigatensis TaxID=1397264 RepID=UPI0026669B06|nr:LysR substrate-binding domain-containing protein [Catalinimonas niigatensis]WPP51943.1 LysR substrate-binding domain-containing protein [Catalinimonas niigatensis]